MILLIYCVGFGWMVHFPLRFTWRVENEKAFMKIMRKMCKALSALHGTLCLCVWMYYLPNVMVCYFFTWITRTRTVLSKLRWTHSASQFRFQEKRNLQYNSQQVYWLFESSSGGRKLQRLPEKAAEEGCETFQPSTMAFCVDNCRHEQQV